LPAHRKRQETVTLRVLTALFGIVTLEVIRYYTFQADYATDPSLWLIVGGSGAFNIWFQWWTLPDTAWKALIADELLEAAHILPDGHPLGEPVIPNGLALCKPHHAAFDRYLIGVTPDLEVTVRLDVLQEIDGPMLRHGLQGFQGRRIHVREGPRADHLSPIATSWPSATPSSAARADRLYPFGHVDTK